jgi:hypothetical protein
VASDEKKKTGRWPAVFAGIGVAISIFSVVISVVALLQSRSVHNELTAVDLRGFASTNSFSSTPAGYAIRVSLTNGSLRPVIIRSMKLEVAGKPIAEVASYLPRGGPGADAASLGDKPIEDARGLPFAISERGAQTVTAFADFSRAASQAYRKLKTPLLARARRFCRELSKTSVEGQGAPWRPKPLAIELEIRADPGGTLIVPVLLSEPIRGANVWRMKVTGPAQHPDGVHFKRRIAAPSSLELLTVKVWRWDGHLERAVSLPAVGSAYADVRFHPLAKGSYRAALLEGSRPLAVGLFDVPLNETHELIYPSDAQTVNGECLRIKGKRDIYDYGKKPHEHLPRRSLPSGDRSNGH